MANQEHVDILMQGVEVWNAWRKEHPGEEPDLSHANLRECQDRMESTISGPEEAASRENTDQFPGRCKG